MTQYLMPKARNLVTGQTVKNQDLSGNRFAPHQNKLAQREAEQLAEKMTLRTGDSWSPFVEAYTPRFRRE